MELNQQCTNLCLSYLPAPSICATACCSKFLYLCSQNAELWKFLLDFDFGVDDRKSPPLSTTLSNNCYELYKDWKLTFHGYEIRDVKFANVWWRRTELWLAHHFPAVLNTLCDGATPLAILSAENRLNRVMPKQLQLLYRFHDGQVLLSDTVTCRDNFNALASTFHGLFGGYSYYNTMINVRLLPLEFMEVIHDQLSDYSMQEVARPDLNRDDLINDVLEAGIVFAASNTAITARLEKLFVAHPTATAAATAGASSCSVFVSVGSVWSDMGAAVNACVHHRASSNNQGAYQEQLLRSVSEGSLNHWLLEYLLRLERAVYSVQPINNNEASMGSRLTQILLYPQLDYNQSVLHVSPDSCAAVRGAPTVTAAGAAVAGHRAVSQTAGTTTPPGRLSPWGVCQCDGQQQQDHGSEPGNDSVVMSRAVTRGVEITVGLVFVPETCTTALDQACNITWSPSWSYRVSMRLLPEHCSRPAHMEQCQLTTRHWDISYPAHPLLPAEQIDGPGVIGFTPYLDCALSLKPFQYESMTAAVSLPAVFSGHMSFRCNKAGNFSYVAHHDNNNTPNKASKSPSQASNHSPSSYNGGGGVSPRSFVVPRLLDTAGELLETDEVFDAVVGRVVLTLPDFMY